MNLNFNNISIEDAKRLQSDKNVEKIGEALVMTIPQFKLKLVIAPVYRELYGLSSGIKRAEWLEHYRVVAAAPSNRSSQVLADAYVNGPRLEHRLNDLNQALTVGLHTVPFGGLVDYAVNGYGTLGEAILSTADGAALLTGVGGAFFKSTRLMVSSLTLQGGGLLYRGYQLAQAVGSGEWRRVAALSGEIVIRLLFAKGTYNGYKVILRNKATTPVTSQPAPQPETPPASTKPEPNPIEGWENEGGALEHGPQVPNAPAPQNVRGSVKVIDVPAAQKLRRANPVNGEMTLYHGGTQAGVNNLRTNGIQSVGLDDGLFNVSTDPAVAVRYANHPEWGAVPRGVAVIRIPEATFQDLYRRGLIKEHSVLGPGNFQITPEGAEIINKLLGH